VRGAAVGISYANLANFLVSNISDGISGDLKIGVYDGNTNGREAVRIAAGSGKFDTSVGITGYVGIGGGWQSLASGNGNRILAPLDVRGEIRAGLTVSATPQGRDLLVSRYTTDDVVSNGTTAAAVNVIGTRYLSSSLALGHGVRSAVGSDGWISSLPSTVSTARSALVVGLSGSDPALVWKTASSSGTALGSAVTLTDAFSVVGATATFNTTIVANYGTNRILANLSGPQFTQTTARISSRGSGNAFEWGDTNSAGYGCVLGSQNTNGAPFLGFYCESGTNTNTYRTRGWTGWILKGNNGGTDDGFAPHSFVFATINNPNADNQTPTERMRITSDGKVGIANASPAAALDVVGNIKTDTGLVLGGATFAAPSGTAPLFGARAWARFTSAAGSMVGGEYRCTISASGNISKIVRIETGVVDVYFDRPMPDAYYSVVAIASKRLPNRDTNVCWYLADDSVPTTTSFRMYCTAVNYVTSGMQDVGLGSVIVFR